MHTYIHEVIIICVYTHVTYTYVSLLLALLSLLSLIRPLAVLRTELFLQSRRQLVAHALATTCHNTTLEVPYVGASHVGGLVCRCDPLKKTRNPPVVTCR